MSGDWTEYCDGCNRPIAMLRRGWTWRVDDRALLVPAPLLAKIQQHDREAGAAIARRDEMVKLALDLLGVGEMTGGNLDIQTGAVTFPNAE